jgi:hypothetical protein
VAHGTIKDDAELPLAGAETLMEKYIAGALKQLVLGMNATSPWEGADDDSSE